MMNRILPLIFMLTVTSMVQAQAPGYFFFESATAINGSQLKHIIQAVKDADPSADVFHSDDMRIIQVKQAGGLTEQGYRAAITQAGVTLLPGTRTAEELGLNQIPANSPPMYVGTGDDAADMARYQASVAQWNAAHPDQQVSATPVHLR